MPALRQIDGGLQLDYAIRPPNGTHCKTGDGASVSLLGGIARTEGSGTFSNGHVIFKNSLNLRRRSEIGALHSAAAGCVTAVSARRKIHRHRSLRSALPQVAAMNSSSSKD